MAAGLVELVAATEDLAAAPSFFDSTTRSKTPKKGAHLMPNPNDSKWIFLLQGLDAHATLLDPTATLTFHCRTCPMLSATGGQERSWTERPSAHNDLPKLARTTPGRPSSQRVCYQDDERHALDCRTPDAQPPAGAWHALHHPERANRPSAPQLGASGGLRCSQFGPLY